MEASSTSAKPTASHRFLDEAGDTTFFGTGRTPVVGQSGVSLCFAIGMVKFAGDYNPIREQVRLLQKEIECDRYFNVIPSVAKKVAGKGFHFHATDDPPEVRARFFKYIDSLDCSCEVVVARKLPAMFISKHQAKDSEFYADVLSHLLKNKFQLGQKLVLNIAERNTSTKNTNLQHALDIALQRFARKSPTHTISSQAVFNVQNPHTEPLLNVVDYMCWSVQRVFERGETRYYDYLGEKIKLVIDLYDDSAYAGHKNYYKKGNRLTAGNKLSPPSP